MFSYQDIHLLMQLSVLVSDNGPGRRAALAESTDEQGPGMRVIYEVRFTESSFDVTADNPSVESTNIIFLAAI